MTTLRNRMRRLRNAQWRYAHGVEFPSLIEWLVLAAVMLWVMAT